MYTPVVKEASRTPDDYLDAALRVIAADGAPKLTLAQVARAAGVSKGGLLHHFPNKEALLGALLEREFDAFEAAVERQAERSGDPFAARTRALITVSFAAQTGGHNLLLSLLAAVFENPELLGTVRLKWAAYRRRFLQDGLPGAQAMLIQLALDGLFFADLLALEPPADGPRDDLRRALLALTQSPPHPTQGVTP